MIKVGDLTIDAAAAALEFAIAMMAVRRRSLSVVVTVDFLTGSSPFLNLE